MILVSFNRLFESVAGSYSERIVTVAAKGSSNSQAFHF